MSSQPTSDYAALLAKFIPPQRLAHSENVARAAVQLARRWAPELETPAQLAGLLHDNAKKMPVAELLAFCEQRGLPISDVERNSPGLLHGKVGAALLAERFDVRDAAVEQAVRDHVTGRKGMDMLSRILYVADQAAADRTFSGVEDLRAVMFEDLDAAVLLVAKHKLLLSAKHGLMIEPSTVDLYNSLIDKQLNG